MRLKRRGFLKFVNDHITLKFRFFELAEKDAARYSAEVQAQGGCKSTLTFEFKYWNFSANNEKEEAG